MMKVKVVMMVVMMFSILALPIAALDAFLIFAVRTGTLLALRAAIPAAWGIMLAVCTLRLSVRVVMMVMLAVLGFRVVMMVVMFAAFTVRMVVMMMVMMMLSVRMVMMVMMLAV